MRTRQVLLAAAVLSILVAMFALMLTGRSRAREGPQVLFIGTTNRATGQIAVFRIVNHGPGQIVLWEPGTLDIEGSTISGVSPRRMTGTYIQPGTATTAVISFEKPSGRWRASFSYDLVGWREKLERWIANRQHTAPMQKWARSEWIEP